MLILRPHDYFYITKGIIEWIYKAIYSYKNYSIMSSEWPAWNIFAKKDTWMYLHYLPYLFNAFRVPKIF